MVHKIPAVIGVADNCQEGNRYVNTGNLTHAVAARRILGDYVDFPTATPWDDATVERLQANHSHIVIVFANAIRLGGIAPDTAKLHKTITENLKKVDLPVVVFGLGSQAQKKPGPGEDLITAPETIEMIQLLGERCRKIAVRGAFTAQVLEHFGAKNAEVMGCQSCFWHLTPEFPLTLPQPGAAPEKPIGFSYTGPLREWQLIKFAMDHDVDMVGQQHYLEYLIKTGADTTQEYEGPAKGLTMLYEREQLQKDAYEAYIRKHFYMFYDLDQWFEFIKDYRFFYGSRFHGCMTALQAGIPSVWVAHDTRTEELCNHLKLPSVTLEQAKKFTHMEQYFEAADYSAFYTAYPENYRRLYDYLAAADVPNRLHPPLPPGQHPAVATERAESSSGLLQEITSISSAMSALSRRLDALTQQISRTEVTPDTATDAPAATPANAPLDPEVERRRLERAAAYKTVQRPASLPEERKVGDAVQMHGNTDIDRYPGIFKAAADLHHADKHKRGARVLSFGCSTGEEAITFAQRYFTNKRDRILGVDVVESFIEEAQAANPDPKRLTFALSSEKALKDAGPFDVIFAMSVLCRWPESKDVEDISELMPFVQFERYVRNLDSHLAVGGRLVLYNTSFRFTDLSFADRYEPEPIADIAGSGFVKKFGKDNKSLGVDYVYPYIIFRKTA